MKKFYKVQALVSGNWREVDLGAVDLKIGGVSVFPQDKLGDLWGTIKMAFPLFDKKMSAIPLKIPKIRIIQCNARGVVL